MSTVALRYSESRFQGCRGVSLYWRSVRPERPWASLAFHHGYGDHSGRYIAVFEALARRGYSVHAFDARGHGRSEGRRGYVRRWDEYLADLETFLRAVGRATGELPLFLMTQSHGGLVLAARGERGPLPGRGVVLCSPFFRMAMRVPAWKIAIGRTADRVWPWLRLPNGLDRDMLSEEDLREPEEEAALDLGTSTPRWYFSALRMQATVLAEAGRFTAPLLVLHGEADPIAALAGAEAFVASAGSAEKALHRVAEGRHDLLRGALGEATLPVIDAWLRSRAGQGE